MSIQAGKGRWFTAFVVSLMLNSLISGAGMLSRLAKPLVFLGYLSRALAAPPALLIGWLIRPKEQTLVTVVVAGVEGLLFSIVFYTAAIWLLLVLRDKLQPEERKR